MCAVKLIGGGCEWELRPGVRESADANRPCGVDPSPGGGNSRRLANLLLALPLVPIVAGAPWPSSGLRLTPGEMDSQEAWLTSKAGRWV